LTAPAPRDVQYFEMLGSRSIIADGWKATTDHVSKGVVDEELLLEGSRSFDDDTWALFRMADDFAEAHDLGAQHPEVLAHLEQLWADEAESNHVLPIADDLLGRLASILLPSNTPGTRCVYRPAGGPVPDESVPRFFGDFTITADVVTPEADANGVLWAIGDWTGGCALYARDGHLVFALNRAGDAVNVVTSRAISAGAHTLACAYTLDPAGPKLTVLEDDEVIEQTTLPVPVPIVWQHGGTMLTLGYDRGLPVSDDYDVPFPWTGVLHEVVVETGRGVSRDLGAEIGAAFLSADCGIVDTTLDNSASYCQSWLRKLKEDSKMIVFAASAAALLLALDPGATRAQPK
jgi:arylsulfatase